jgi:hypothetical protein
MSRAPSRCFRCVKPGPRARRAGLARSDRTRGDATWRVGVVHAQLPEVRCRLTGRRQGQPAGRGCPCPVARRSRRPPWPSLTPRKRRSAIPGFAGFLGRLSGHGQPRGTQRAPPAPRALLRPSTPRHAAGAARAACPASAFNPVARSGRRPRRVPCFGLQPRGTQRAQPAPRALRVALPRRQSAPAGSPPLSGRTPSAARNAAGRAEALRARRGHGWPGGRFILPRSGRPARRGVARGRRRAFFRERRG